MKRTESLQHHYSEQGEKVCVQQLQVQLDRPEDPDIDWLRFRRSVQGSVRQMLHIRRNAEEDRDLGLLASSQE